MAKPENTVYKVFSFYNMSMIKKISTVHCEWDDWELGECSTTCGGGNRTKTRKEKVSSAFGGDECDGPPSITESCNVGECPGKKLIKFILIKANVML